MSDLRALLSAELAPGEILPMVILTAETDAEAKKRALTAGNRMFFAGEIERREAVSKPVIENAYSALLDHGYVVQQVDGKLGLAESFKNPKAVKAIEGRIAVYLGEAVE